MEEIIIHCKEAEFEHIKAALNMFDGGCPYKFEFHRTDPPPPARWRAEKGESYYIIDMYGKIYEYPEEYSEYGDMLYEFGNYFRTRKAAKKYLSKIRELFAENLGES
jgi:hypothetical protein